VHHKFRRVCPKALLPQKDIAAGLMIALIKRAHGCDRDPMWRSGIADASFFRILSPHRDVGVVHENERTRKTLSIAVTPTRRP
jgi:hypothetical protein